MSCNNGTSLAPVRSEEVARLLALRTARLGARQRVRGKREQCRAFLFLFLFFCTSTCTSTITCAFATLSHNAAFVV